MCTCLLPSDAERAIEFWQHTDDIETLLELMRVRETPTLANEPAYRTRFNGYYQLGRQRAEFYQTYFMLLYELASARREANLPALLQELYQATGKVHLSFCSKMIATVDDNGIVFDRLVATFCNAPHLGDGTIDNGMRRFGLVVEEITTLVGSPTWPPILAIFNSAFPRATHLSDVRKADLVIWAYMHTRGF